jgi:hypothetical protein
MLHLRWSTTAAAIGATIATGAGATTMIAVGQNTTTKAIVAADIESHHSPTASAFVSLEWDRMP